MTFFFSQPPIPTQGKTFQSVTRMIANATSKSENDNVLHIVCCLNFGKSKALYLKCKKGHEEKQSNRRNIINNYIISFSVCGYENLKKF